MASGLQAWKMSIHRLHLTQSPCFHLRLAPGNVLQCNPSFDGPDPLGTFGSVVGPRGQFKVSEQILEVKAGDLSFIVGNLSIKPVYWRAAPFRMTSLWMEHLMPIYQIKFCAPLNQIGGSTGAGNKQRFTSSGSISSRTLASLLQPLYWGDI